MRLKHTIAAILEENQDELFCPFCTKPKGDEIDCCDQSGNWFRLRYFDFDTQFSIAQQIFNSQKGVPNQKSDGQEIRVCIYELNEHRHFKNFSKI